MQAQQKHEGILKAEREEMTKHFEDMKQKLLQDLAISNDDSEHSANGNDAIMDSSEVPLIITSTESPENRIKKTKGAMSVSEREPASSIPMTMSPLIIRGSQSPASVSKLQVRKKAEKKIIDSLCLEESMQGKGQEHSEKRERRSLDGLSTIPKPIGDKLTITQLVESSLSAPGTIASIRKQLKEDGLTPKIKKKFEKQELPAVTDLHSEKTPVPVEGRRAIRREPNGSNGGSNSS